MTEMSFGIIVFAILGVISVMGLLASNRAAARLDRMNRGPNRDTGYLTPQPGERI